MTAECNIEWKIQDTVWVLLLVLKNVLNRKKKIWNNKNKKKQKSAADRKKTKVLFRMEMWTTLPDCLSTGKHISRAEMKENGNICLDLKLVIIMILPKDCLNSHSQKYLPLFFHVQFYKSKGNGYCKTFWKHMDDFFSEHPRTRSVANPFI